VFVGLASGSCDVDSLRSSLETFLFVHVALMVEISSCRINCLFVVVVVVVELVPTLLCIRGCEMVGFLYSWVVCRIWCFRGKCHEMRIICSINCKT